jgi:hypothetical protein
VGRLGKFVNRNVKAVALEFVSKIKFRYENFKEFEYERLLEAESSFSACPSSIESTDDGNFLLINRERYSQAFYVASPSKVDQAEGGIRKTADPFVLDKIMDVTNDKNIDLTITQILYKMPAAEESKEVDKELAKIDMIKETDLKLHGRYSRRLDHQAKDVENFSEQSFDGTHRRMKQLIITRVDGSDKLEVEKNSAHLQTILRSHGVLTQVPYGGQMGALRSSLMSNEINLNMVSKLMSNVAAAMWPGRNPLKQLDTEGILIGYVNTSKNSMMPIYWNPEDPKYSCKHLSCWGGSGKGKSTMFQYIIWNAVGANCDFILFVPKEDMGTSHLNLIEVLGGSLIYIGEAGKNFNLFMVFYNPDTQGKDIKDRKRAYVRHKESLINFFSLIIGSAFSPAMSGVLKRLIRELYTDAKLVDGNVNPINTDNWSKGEHWPCVSDLVIKIESWIGEDAKKKDRRSLEALRGYLMDFDNGEALHFLDNHETFFPSDPRMVIDVSGISSRFKDAITILLVDMISTRLKTPSPEAFKAKKRTLIAFDEGANLMKMPGMDEYIPKLLREARAGKCSILIDNQDINGLSKILPVLKTNTDAMIFMCDMGTDEIKEFETEFTFTDKDKRILMEKGKGKFLFVKNGLKLPGKVILSNTQRKVIFNEEIPGQVSEGMFCEDYKLIDGLEWVRDEEGVLSDNWITERTDIKIPGYKRVTNLWPPTSDLSRVVWLREDLHKMSLICGESRDHYMTCALIAGELYRAGCTNIQIHHNGGQGLEDADITCITPDGKILWIEYAHPKSRSIGDLEKQKNHQMAYCDIWKCVCQDSNEREVKTAVGRDFYCVRGDAFKVFLQDIAITKQRNSYPSPSQAEA